MAALRDRRRDVYGFLDFENLVLVRQNPALDLRQRLGFRVRRIGGDKQQVLVKLAEFGGIIAAEIDEK